MRINRYTLLGWVVWRLGARMARRRMAQNRVKLTAAGIVAAVLVGGVLAARSGSGSDD